MLILSTTATFVCRQVKSFPPLVWVLTQIPVGCIYSSMTLCGQLICNVCNLSFLCPQISSHRHLQTCPLCIEMSLSHCCLIPYLSLSKSLWHLSTYQLLLSEFKLHPNSLFSIFEARYFTTALIELVTNDLGHSLCWFSVTLSFSNLSTNSPGEFLVPRINSFIYNGNHLYC